MIRTVFDTVVFLRALLNPKSRSGRLLFGYADQLQIIVSQATAQELLEVLQRPELTRKYPNLNAINNERVIDLLAQAETVEVVHISKIVRDPKDDIIVATALAGHADYLVSEDKDLLTLKQVETVRIVDTATFIKMFEQDEN